MRLATVRVTADWLADPTNGAATILAGLTLDAGDARPTIAAVYDETRHGWVARGEFPAASASVVYSCLTVAVGRAGDTDYGDFVRTVEQLGRVPIVIRHAVKKVDSEKAVSDAYYVEDAVRASLNRVNRNVNAAALARLGRYSIEAVEEIRTFTLFAPLGDAVVTNAIVASVRVMDSSPT